MRKSSAEDAQNVVDGVIVRLAARYEQGVPLLAQPSDDPRLDREFEIEMRRTEAILRGWGEGASS